MLYEKRNSSNISITTINSYKVINKLKSSILKQRCCLILSVSNQQSTPLVPIEWFTNLESNSK